MKRCPPKIRNGTEHSNDEWPPRIPQMGALTQYAGRSILSVSWVEVNDRMQQGYRYALTAPVGQNFDAGFTPFVLADIAKVLVAGAALPALWRFTGLGRSSR